MTHRIFPLALLIAIFGGFSSQAQLSTERHDRGMTAAPFSLQPLISAGQAVSCDPVSKQSPSSMMRQAGSRFDEWRLIDSVSLDTWIPPLGYAGVRFNSGSRRLEVVRSLPQLRAAAQQAVARSPQWIRAKLEHTLSEISGQAQEGLAAVINAASDPYIDEICFAIAHSNPVFLQSTVCFPQLFVDNAQQIYEHDELLPYVEIVDVGSSADGDWYSTARYWRVDADSNRVQVEIPRDIYYWYIVHPKLSDEVSTYVDPAVSESGPSIKPPPDGVFWREYLFTVTEPVPDTTGVDFPVLRDMVSQCDVLWADRGSEPQAVRQITKWIREVLDFTSGSERPHQPARIYKLHMGRCGEHEDLAAAAARACLIPARGISSYSTDHVWNEFWDVEWCQWEPVNNSHKNPLVYSEGWGKKFGTVIARRSDGKFIPVTDRYAKETCTLEIHAKDAGGKPVDGAVVLIAMRVDQSIYIDTYGCTDQNGVAHFILGKDNDYFARFDSPRGGSSPSQANQVSALMTGAVAGRNYSFELRSTANKPVIRQEGTIDGLEDDIDDFVIEHVIEDGAQAVRWQQRFDDINAIATCVFFSEETGGTIGRGYVDEENFQAVRLQNPFAMKWGVPDQLLGQPVVGSVEGVDFTKNPYYLFVNHTNANNPVHVRMRFYLRMSPLVDVDETPSVSTFRLLSFAPHPVGTEGAFLTLSVPPEAVGGLRIELFDILGRLRHSKTTDLSHGVQTLRWNPPPSLAPGQYLMRLLPKSGAVIQRLLIMH
ncbi:MAG: hypothetical protein JXA28_10745 [Bacteroidetes bacterium]|nr:hypothetical protein [Bacteroidota bacterium]